MSPFIYVVIGALAFFLIVAVGAALTKDDPTCDPVTMILMSCLAAIFWPLTLLSAAAYLTGLLVADILERS
jgi:hypothetical protein